MVFKYFISDLFWFLFIDKRETDLSRILSRRGNENGTKETEDCAIAKTQFTQ